MKTKKLKSKIKTKYSKKTCYNKLPTRVTQNEFNAYIRPYLSKGKRGPKTKISYYKIFNYILYVLHTGIQWDRLLTCRNEIYWTNIYKHHNRWSKDGNYKRIFESSVAVLDKLRKLDLSLFHIDGSNVVAKKGEKKSAIRDINIRKAIKT
ncbi:MAG: transposase [bacterium]|nr:transposase [bacterium]